MTRPGIMHKFGYYSGTNTIKKIFALPSEKKKMIASEFAKKLV